MTEQNTTSATGEAGETGEGLHGALISGLRRRCEVCAVLFFPNQSDVRYCAGCRLTHHLIVFTGIAAAWHAEEQRREGRS